MTIEKTFAGLTAVLDESGISVYWDKTKTRLQRKILLGNSGTGYRNVFLPLDGYSFGFTEEDLNTCGYATPVEIQTRQPFYGTR